jgi:hypothetical protein
MFVRRFPRSGLFLVFFVWFFGYNALVTAGILTIETETSVTVEGDLLKVSVKATNKGTEPAHNVQVHLIALGEKKSGLVKAQLSKGQSHTVTFEKVLSGSKKGRYPLIVLVDFHDANQYPFSAVSCTTFSFKEDVNPDLICLGNDTSIENNGLLRFRIKNLGLGSRIIQATLVLPKELSTPRPQMDFQIDPRAERTFAFEINNFSALSGASYPVFCLIEYDLEDTHYTAIAKAIVKIAKKENWFKRTRLIWLGAATLLGVILVASQLKRKGP